MSYTIETKYFNSFWLKNIITGNPFAYYQAASLNPTDYDLLSFWPGIPWLGVGNGYPNFPTAVPTGRGNAQNAPGTGLRGNPYGFMNFYLEETRIKGGFNNPQLSLGVRAYVVNENRSSTNRKHSLIYSGLLNTRTGFNQTNVFSIADPIIKDLDPINGSIQKLYTEDTNLNVFQENKVSKVLINKNAIYSGDQGSQDGNNNFLGQPVGYLGEYGISRNPESFAFYGYRKYFSDRDRASILRLSRDGITEISSYGMKDFFRDTLSKISDNFERQEISKPFVASIPSPIGVQTSFILQDQNENFGKNIELGAALELYSPSSNSNVSTGSIVTLVEDLGTSIRITIEPGYNFGPEGSFSEALFVTYARGQIYGAWDAHQSAYTTSLQTKPRTISTAADTFSTLGFDESILGWTSFYSYKPNAMGSLKNKFYSFIDSEIYQHYNELPNTRGKFYGATSPAESFVEFIFNPNPSVVKNFQTISYEGSNGWEVDSYKSDFQGFDRIRNNSGVVTGSELQFQDSTKSIKSFVEGQYDSTGAQYPAALTQPIFRVGFDRKENYYVANLVSDSIPRPGEIIYGNQVSGVKGYLVNVKMSLDSSTDPGGTKELFSVSSNFVVSSMP